MVLLPYESIHLDSVLTFWQGKLFVSQVLQLVLLKGLDELRLSRGIQDDYILVFRLSTSHPRRPRIWSGSLCLANSHTSEPLETMFCSIQTELFVW